MAELITTTFNDSDYPLLTEDIDQPWSAQGRFGRLSYMAWVMLTALCAVATISLLMTFSTIAEVSLNSEASMGFLVIGLLCFTPLLYFMIIFQIRRLHDLNLSGWWVGLPLVNWVIMQMLIVLTHSDNLALVLTVASCTINIIFMLGLMITPGSEDVNQYDMPRQTLQWEKTVGWFYAAFSIIGLIWLTLAMIPTYQSYQKQAAMMHVSIEATYSLPKSSVIH